MDLTFWNVRLTDLTQDGVYYWDLTINGFSLNCLTRESVDMELLNECFSSFLGALHTAE